VTLLVLLGGARSGKSRLAQQLAAEIDAPVTFIATATAGDEEMAAKIAAHRAERPQVWSTVEEPFDLVGAIAHLPAENTAVVDCLTLWVANLVERGDDVGAILEDASRAAVAAVERPAATVVVSNEVGLGVVPATELGRTYRDVLGEVNRIWTARADRALFTVAGRVLLLDGVEELARDLAGR
jgi:adenosyl cobinamide kinase/adenosyl cobinamide phosphate guanylyltransferase